MLDTISGPATLLQEHGDTAIVCSYEVTETRPLGPEGPPGLSDWRGTFTIDDPSAVLMPGPAVLRLADGREGAVIVTAVDITGGAGTLGGRFAGNGAPPT